MANFKGLLDSGYLGDLGIGLLGASGYSTMPTTIGQNIAQGVMFADQRQQAKLQNQFIRDKMRGEAERQKAAAQMSGLLTQNTQLPSTPVQGMDGAPIGEIPGFRVPTMQTPQGQQQMLGLLGQAAPEQTAQMLLGQMFPAPQQERAEPSSIREFKALYPDVDLGTPQGREKYFELQKQSGVNGDQLDALVTRTNLELNLMKLEQERAAAETAKKTAEQQFRTAEFSVNETLKYIDQAAELNNKLAPTFLASGGALADLRAMSTLAFADAKRMVGGDDTKARALVEDFNTFKKLTSKLIVDSMGKIAGNGVGTATNQKMDLLASSMAGVGVTPATNNQILADTIESLIGTSEIDKYYIDKKDYYLELAKSLRGKTATPAAAPATTANKVETLDNGVTVEYLQ